MQKEQMAERRRSNREDFMGVVRYGLSQAASDIVLTGMIMDYNHHGICLIALQPLEEGQEITVDSVIMPFAKKATIR